MNHAKTPRRVHRRGRRTTESILGLLPAVAVALVLAATPLAAQTEESADGEDRGIAAFGEELVVVGTRGEGRSVAESMVPVDVLAGEDFLAQGDTDVANLVRNLAPSYNVSMQPISDASSIVRPAYLRNLAPDHTLVLVNGKRRHRAAVIHWHGDAVSIGAQGPDLAVIPAIALRQVEVLRDGASAQYGSDAIAGVMNFLLKDASSGGSVEIRSGSHGEGDGDLFTAAANFGLPLGENGFFNLSMEYGSTDPTDRSIQRRDAANLIAAGNTHVRQPKSQIWGSPEVSDDAKLFLNFGHLFESSGRQLYGHANYAGKTVNGGFFFRNPNTRGGVFSGDGGGTLLIGDLLDAQDGVLDGSAGCPTVAVTDDVPDPVALGRVFDDPNCFSYQELFPGGFTPNFGGDNEDMSVVAGLRGASSGGIGWDLSVSTGENSVDHFISNTVNASLGPDSPTSFSLGTYTQRETNVNYDLTYSVSERVSVAGGLEWRNEEFEIGRGQRESYLIGPLAAQGFSSGSNGFPGFSDLAAGKWGRSNHAAYGDVEIDGPDGRWAMGAAVRFEDFDDFGTTMNSKIAGRYRVTERLALRGSLSSGFRAPTPGQQNAFNVQTQFDTSIQDLVNNGTIPSTSAVARLRGGEPLQPETSLNFAIGAVVENGPFAMTVDVFRIDVEDRIAVTQNFQLTPEEVATLVAEGVTSAANLRNFRFFTNDFDTESVGADLVLTVTPESMGGRTSFAALANLTRTDIVRSNPVTFGPSRIRDLEQALPESRYSVTAKHRSAGDRVRYLARLNYFDRWFDRDNNESYPGENTLDLEIGFRLRDGLRWVFGGTNVLDTYPEENPFALNVGELYSERTPWGFNGAFWYSRLTYSFGDSF